ncbi:hypothetical protein HK097_005547 [Rhizophlyctis rosea]|uniref:Uncharacterized protein n=1 Tax=Rhizophlyctis rosea TaxID=64517 RepID=A0AAD5X4T6_9FUNG|nr:hypothetical protein HK097_005547 [Rhizophlyctis rosea]
MIQQPTTSATVWRPADKNLFEKEIENLLKEDEDDDDDILNMSFTLTPTTVRSADPLSSEPRRSSRMKKDISYAPPPLDPFQDQQLLAQAGRPSPGKRLFESSSRITPGKKPKYDLDTFVKGKKKHEERMRRYKELDDIKFEDIEAEDGTGMGDGWGIALLPEEAGSRVASILEIKVASGASQRRLELFHACEHVVPILQTDNLDSNDPTLRFIVESSKDRHTTLSLLNSNSLWLDIARADAVVQQSLCSWLLDIVSHDMNNAMAHAAYRNLVGTLGLEVWSEVLSLNKVHDILASYGCKRAVFEYAHDADQLVHTEQTQAGDPTETQPVDTGFPLFNFTLFSDFLCKIATRRLPWTTQESAKLLVLLLKLSLCDTLEDCSHELGNAAHAIIDAVDDASWNGEFCSHVWEGIARFVRGDGEICASMLRPLSWGSERAASIRRQIGIRWVKNRKKLQDGVVDGWRCNLDAKATMSDLLEAVTQDELYQRTTNYLDLEGGVRVLLYALGGGDDIMAEKEDALKMEKFVSSLHNSIADPAGRHMERTRAKHQLMIASGLLQAALATFPKPGDQRKLVDFALVRPE